MANKGDGTMGGNESVAMGEVDANGESRHVTERDRCAVCGLPSHTGKEPCAIAQAREIGRLRAALHEAGNFACFNENRVGDPCACCEHVSEIARDAADGS